MTPPSPILAPSEHHRRRADVYADLLRDAHREIAMWHDMMQDVTDNATNERTAKLIERIERALAGDGDASERKL